MIKMLLSIIFIALILTGCSLEGTIDQGKDLLEKGNQMVEKSEEALSDLNTDLNKVTTFFDSNISEIQNTEVYEEDFTFKELIDVAVEKPIWTSESETYVTVSGKINLPSFMVEKYGDVEEIILGFPFSDGMALANAGAFTTIDGAVKVDGVAYEVSGEEVIFILSDIYKNK